MSDDTHKSPPRDTDKPSKTAQKDVPGIGEGAAARGYARDEPHDAADPDKDSRPGETPEDD